MEIREGLPHLFIGSSSEGLDIANHLHKNLRQYHYNVRVWNQGVFDLNQSYLESLVGACKQYNFAALVLTPDDMLTERGDSKMTARDNVLFELGLFIGSLGLDRTFIVCHEKVKLPSDLDGIKVVEFSRHQDEPMESAINPVATDIREAIEKVRNRDNAQTSIQNMLQEFFKYNDHAQELKEAHHRLQDLARPLNYIMSELAEALIREAKVEDEQVSQRELLMKVNKSTEKPPSWDTVKTINRFWGLSLIEFSRIERDASKWIFSEYRSVFREKLVPLKEDFNVSLKNPTLAKLYECSCALCQECQEELSEIDEKMLEQFSRQDRIKTQILRSNGNDTTQS